MIFKLVKTYFNRGSALCSKFHGEGHGFNWPKENGGVNIPSFLGFNWSLNYVKMFNIIIKETCLPNKVKKG
jgi:hypothetical protein